MSLRTALLALAAGLVLADASVVTLALPQILSELHTTIEGVAAVIGVYTVVLAAGLVPFERAAARYGPHVVGGGGFLLLAAASVACAAAQSLGVLLAGRVLQGVGGAAGLAVVFELLGGAGPGRRLWLGAAVLATAIGPALGGVLTQAFDWRAIFIAGVPVGLAGAGAALVSRAPARVAEADSPLPPRPAIALALVSAALTAVLFLLVLLLVAGWNISPLRAALTVSMLPVAALVGARIGGDPGTRAVVGSLLIGGGVLAIAWLPGAEPAWTLAPQALAGVGMGMALTALGGGLLPERTPRDAARLLVVRHLGIALILAALAPLAAAQLDRATERARERGVALVLDAPLTPQQKIALAPSLLRSVESDQPRAGLRRATARERHRFAGAELVAYDRLAVRADDVLVDAVGDAFRSSFVLAALAGFAAALVLLAGARLAVAAAAAALAAATAGGYAVAHSALAPPVPQILDPCTAQRTPPATGGATGFLQDAALKLLDRVACRLGSSREELVLALADPAEAKRFQRAHGVDPRSLGGILSAILR
ncbi:MAG: MFS transporter [Solirubrobacteraceae bacterium]